MRHTASTTSSLLVRTLDWDAPTEWGEEEPNLILAADVIYDPILVSPLARTLRSLLSGPVKSIALLAATVREPRTWEQFLSCCSSECIEVRKPAYSSRR
ncbi:hypothetical protein DFH28DRAFT_431482 [Melampsora americana]|nr:hypothetical protein DFH28DRAFT_431482 [Melampsora americana]